MHARCHAVSGRSRPRAQAARHVAAALSTASLTQSAPHGSPPGIVDLFVSTHPSTAPHRGRARARVRPAMTTRSRPGGASSGRASQSSYRAARQPAIRGRGSGLWAGSEQRSRSLAAARAQGTPPPPPACAARDCVGVTRAARGRCGGEPACPCPASSTPPRRPHVSASIPWCRGGREVRARVRLSRAEARTRPCRWFRVAM